jgi:hypothetical protein
MVSRYRSGVIAIFLLTAIGGCDMLGITQSCATYAAPGIEVVLRDSATNGPILSGEALIVATDGAYADSVRFTIEPRNYNVGAGLAEERTGTYSVEAHVTDYRSWTMDGIQVRETSDGCHVLTRTLYTRLDPEE